ncbi:unnamed protein product [marine sediment metagenome]|uniref:Uncharacterized protein n=1 Tax=marine sediment metagenome TaxID=412755 RepID=X1D3G4_9ZZZZ
MLAYEHILKLAKSKNLIPATTNIDVLKKETITKLTDFKEDVLAFGSDPDTYYDMLSDATSDLLFLWFPNVTKLMKKLDISWSKFHSLDLRVHKIVDKYYKDNTPPYLVMS